MKTIFEAVCQNKIASVRLMLDSELAHVSKVYRKGDKKNFFTKYKEDIIVYKGTKYSFSDLCKLLGPIVLYITDKNTVRVASQVIIHYQNTPYDGTLECHNFDTDQEARDYYLKLIEENSIEQI